VAAGADGSSRGSASRKRCVGVSTNNRLAKKQKTIISPTPKLSADEMEELVFQNEIAKAENEFNRKRHGIISQLPPSYGIGNIGVVKAGRSNKKFVVLVCHPYDVPASPVREDWLKLYFKVTSKKLFRPLL
jgi:hypothetical protein